LREGEIVRLEGKVLFRGTGVLGESAFAGSKDNVPGLEARDVRTDSFDDSSYICTETREPGLANACEQADEPWRAAKEVPVVGIDRGRANVDQDFVCAGRRLLDFGVFENVGRSVAMIKDGVRSSLLIYAEMIRESGDLLAHKQGCLRILVVSLALSVSAAFI
jgi:hypothetical protein